MEQSRTACGFPSSSFVISYDGTLTCTCENAMCGLVRMLRNEDQKRRGHWDMTRRARGITTLLSRGSDPAPRPRRGSWVIRSIKLESCAIKLVYSALQEQIVRQTATQFGQSQVVVRSPSSLQTTPILVQLFALFTLAALLGFQLPAPSATIYERLLLTGVVVWFFRVVVLWHFYTFGILHLGGVLYRIRTGVPTGFGRLGGTKSRFIRSNV